MLKSFQEQLEIVPEEEEMMNWEDIKECLNSKVEIASHSFSHDSLISILDRDKLENEIINSKTGLENKLNKTIRHFVFPNGLYNNLVIDIAKEAGYEYLYLLDDQLQPLKGKSSIVSRISIYHDTILENQFKVESSITY